MIEFNFKNLTSDKIEKNTLKEILSKFAQEFYPNQDVQLSLKIVDKKEIIKLNKEILDHSGSTDVISLENPVVTTPKSLGDIIICSEVAKQNAQKLNHSWEEEIKILFKHGLIHLLGLEHSNEKEKKVWQKTLKRL